MDLSSEKQNSSNKLFSTIVLILELVRNVSLVQRWPDHQWPVLSIYFGCSAKKRLEAKGNELFCVCCFPPKKPRPEIR